MGPKLPSIPIHPFLPRVAYSFREVVRTGTEYPSHLSRMDCHSPAEAEFDPGGCRFPESKQHGLRPESEPTASFSKMGNVSAVSSTPGNWPGPGYDI